MSSTTSYYLDIQDKISQAKALRSKIDFKIAQAMVRTQSLLESKDALDTDIRRMENCARFNRSTVNLMATIHHLGKRLGL